MSRQRDYDLAMYRDLMHRCRCPMCRAMAARRLGEQWAMDAIDVFRRALAEGE